MTAAVKYRPPLFVETVEELGFDPDYPVDDLLRALKDPYFVPPPEWAVSEDDTAPSAAEATQPVEPQLLLVGLTEDPNQGE